ncbi:hypothetical protein [Deinococcus sp. QL22]|uniref:hypothetical protein n=1 Tax=Deinococcus sp. QL22 TaxID=2939437 RepID=UPI0020172628|nr:hypothetical protein [Deinococcus sp. QL22]UQN06321.1 hypothetical protein M1R55_15900 [Deinococcus sp. QL22]
MTAPIPGVHTALKRGQDTVMPNWALEAFDTLTLMSDAKLLNWLTRHRQYRANSYSTKQLAIALELDPRTVRDGLVRLREAGYILSVDGLHCSVDAHSRLTPSQIKAAATPVQASRKPAATPVQIYPAQNAEYGVQNEEKQSLKKGRKEYKEEKNLKPQAQEDAAPWGEDPAAPVQDEVQSPARQKTNGTDKQNVPAARRAAGESTPFQELFAALALACYGGQDDLTNSASIRLASAAKSFDKAKFVASDIPPLVAWLHQTESWRDAVTPQVLEERAPAWRATLRGSLPARPMKAHVVKFTPRPQSTEQANQQAADRASDIYAALQEGTHAVF